MTFATKRLFSLQASGSVVSVPNFTYNYNSDPCFIRTYNMSTIYIELVAIQTVRTGGSKLIGVLVGNKSDQRDGTIDSRSEVTPEAAEAFAKQLNLPYFEASAVRNIEIYHILHYNNCAYVLNCRHLTTGTEFKGRRTFQAHCDGIL